MILIKIITYVERLYEKNEIDSLLLGHLGEVRKGIPWRRSEGSL